MSWYPVRLVGEQLVETAFEITAGGAREDGADGGRRDVGAAQAEEVHSGAEVDEPDFGRWVGACQADRCVERDRFVDDVDPLRRHPCVLAQLCGFGGAL